MRLRELFGDDAVIDPPAPAAAVTGLAVDSRAVKPGDLFFALAGSKTDGARFIDAAVASGPASLPAPTQEPVQEQHALGSRQPGGSPLGSSQAGGSPLGPRRPAAMPAPAPQATSSRR